MASFGLANPSVAMGGTGPVDVATIFSAASEGNLALLQSSMAQMNFNVTTADENGYTLLHAASSYNQLRILKFILDNLDRNNPNCIASINAGDNDGDTALHYAGSVDAARMLIEDGRTDARKVNSQGKTALQAKKEELGEMMQDEDIEDDDEDVEVAQKLIEYLSGVP
uniref:Ankyrin repeat-containing protein n=1 Tax=Pseudo-nitzschia australis TaxID=44445 RepID=A0A7S4AXG2_9STRA|mmetsp:Transcript_26425/g.57905  ORF Transcript_26425/g.57905 Transcript_26425/m.57905 type:complete len:168 (-) Transcript_26425:526-1029(-)|eukprot:CAMPEP_0168183962 /NCGR_PEP_ID=MMETSP0139_2-20121125/12934_1 /TAXON_ID=44445 /ORGANISM="Pseudo-nitzschia australis, Strain 10249 10 AB" /LENGTH=167 /DNA_ID=CAMNT_0008105449 /DNA_START=83 /DNA_END=586 /DNA_ORIENTATION=-